MMYLRIKDVPTASRFIQRAMTAAESCDSVVEKIRCLAAQFAVAVCQSCTSIVLILLQLYQGRAQEAYDVLDKNAELISRPLPPVTQYIRLMLRCLQGVAMSALGRHLDARLLMENTARDYSVLLQCTDKVWVALRLLLGPHPDISVAEWAGDYC